ncbi:MAG: GtrA family protein [Candidatus Microsaccharimonas sossegonensis]|uniref:GtrA family protein n=1 Tax=Candidatus Microsaccharimonas sossegonensis TaxID=2506948 RepID=A0A4Q0AIA5_9BACT|nr:MAG: GtrA family protein [Candidatus Microsaccharimonas sossegonensis]
MERVKKHAEKIRFGVVGIANTGLDFLILFLLVALGLDKIPANYISTGTAFIFSFFVNKSFTFKSKGGNVKKQFLYFIIVTIIGLWIIQPLIIFGFNRLFAGTGWSSGIILFAAKIIATVASLTWNYIFYSRIVFKKIEEK